MAKKTTVVAKKPARARRTSRTPHEAAAKAVRVRMYRQGLGDCFLLTFDVGGDERHVLIDCGSLGATTTGVSLADVVQDIARTTDPKRGKGRLELLVATHAHKDHVIAFRQEREAIEAFEIRNVWMPWTEDPADPLARKLGNAAQALRVAIADAHAMPQMTAGQKERLAGVAEFEGGEMQADGSLAMGDTIAESLDVVRHFAGTVLTYQKPGGPPIELPAIPGFRFYVLGPPYDADKLANMDRDAGELYGLTRAFAAHADMTGAEVDQQVPFDARFGYPLEQADRFSPDYAAPAERYRRIDAQLSDSAEALAARLDRFRNNTSLALAIERIADGRVMLFPADAQQGNDLSWHDAGMEWRIRDAANATRRVDAVDLLARTVFYKVGHHCSHNATARAKGLEIMRKNTELTAFIPVDRRVALKKSPAGQWRMPARALYRELLEACQGRVVRSDTEWADDSANAELPEVEEEFDGLATAAEWKQWKATQATTANVDIQAAYIDYVLR